MIGPDSNRTLLQRLARPGSRENGWLRAGLSAATVVAFAFGARHVLTTHVLGIDLEIPLRAAGRWLDGGEPYLASSFERSARGANLPYLYPPYVLPALVPLLDHSRRVVDAIWVAGCLVAALVALWRLQLGWGAAVPLLAWPPVAYAVMGGNPAILMFAAFMLLPDWGKTGRALPVGAPEAPGITSPGVSADSRPRTAPRTALRTLADGALVAATFALKISALQVLAASARRRPAAAMTAVALVGVLALVTLPLVGLDLWRAFAAQLGRAADPGWVMGGMALPHLLPAPFGTLAVVGTVALAFVATRRSEVGLLTVIGAGSWHAYGLLFLLPALREIRREIALVALVIGTMVNGTAWWVATLLVAAALLGARRWPALLEPSVVESAS